jgi:hypothetical protein
VNGQRDDESVPADEARLLDALGRALGPDPLPAGLLGRVEELIVLRDLDAAVAELLDRPVAEPAGMRGGINDGRLQFESADGSVALEVVAETGRLVGQVLLGDLTEVALERPAGTVATGAVDDLGRFSLEHSGSGPGRLRLIGTTAGPIATDWFLL